MADLSKMEFVQVARDVHKKKVQIFTKPVKYRAHAHGSMFSVGAHRIGKIPTNGEYRAYSSIGARGPSTYTTIIRGFTLKGKPVKTIPLPAFMKPELLNIHKVLAPLYVLFAIFGSVLVANIGIISTANGFYKFIANLGIVLTVISAIIYVAYTYKRM